jgi:hypothetical protein
MFATIFITLFFSYVTSTTVGWSASAIVSFLALISQSGYLEWTLDDEWIYPQVIGWFVEFALYRSAIPFVVFGLRYLASFLDSQWFNDEVLPYLINYCSGALTLLAVFYIGVYDMYFILILVFLPGMWCLAAALVLGPLVLILNFSAAYIFFDFVGAVVTGNYGVQHYNFLPAVRLARDFVRRPIQFLIWLIPQINYVTSTIFVRSFLLMISTSLRAPALIWSLIFEDLPVLRLGDPESKFYFKTRCTFSLAIFLLVFGGFTTILVTLLVIAAAGFILALIFLALTFGTDGFAMPVVLLFSLAKSCMRNFNDAYTSYISRRYKEVALEVHFFVRSYTHRSRVFGRYRNDSGEIVVVDMRTDFRTLPLRVVERLFCDLIIPFHPSTWIFLFAGISLIVTAKMLRVGYRIFHALVFFPIRVIEASVWAIVPFLLPSTIFDVICSGYVYAYIWFDSAHPDWFADLCRWSRLLQVSALTGVAYMNTDDLTIYRGGFEGERISQLFKRQWVSLTRRTIIRFVESLESLRLPEMIQAAYKPPDLESIRSTYVTLKDMGFPVDQTFIDSIDRPESSAYLAEWGSFKNYLMGTSNFSLGFRDVKTALRKWLPADFYPEIPGYIHSATFTGVSEEITSTARYFTGNKLDDIEEFDELAEDLYQSVKAQYANSRLASFEEIYKNWTKKFNMGFGMGTRKGHRLVQATRASVIQAMGGKKAFLSRWEKIFYNAQSMVLPAPVFTKWETLKLKKALSRSVRTVVGSAFTHHVMTTVFNYHPNHNYAVWETPMKVGMPINGQNFNRLWSSLLAHEKVFAGDMTAFDSTQAPVVLRLIAECRKKGYSHLDKDQYDKICQLIDISYEMLRDQPMGFKNFGDIAEKHQGFSTGHSSTTPDNSLALVVNYLYAWRKTTGLRAREFFNFNTLCNFGDDHVLGYDPVFGWNPNQAMKRMAEIGTMMRDEAPGQDFLPTLEAIKNHKIDDARTLKFSFLSKKPIPLTPDVVRELQKARVDVPLTFATIHDTERLIGKIKGAGLSAKEARDPVASYDALLSYMYLCAHQKDVYDKLAREAQRAYQRARTFLIEHKRSLKALHTPPSYDGVLRQWYSSEPFPYSESYGDDDDDENDNAVMKITTSPDPFDKFVRWISDFPTLLSPRYTNTIWADWIQRKASNQISWPLTYVAMSNGVQNDPATAGVLLSRTPYSFLRNDTLSIQDEPYGVLASRHYLYLILTRWITKRRYFNILDLVRLFDTFYINLVFGLTGRVSQIIVELELHIIELVLIFLLSYVNIDLPILPVGVDLLSPSILLARFISWVFRTLSPSGSIDFQPFDNKVLGQQPRYENAFTLKAPTGIGKSTRLIARLQGLVKKRVVVVVPRHLVCVGVGQYMQALYPDTGIGICTEGHKHKVEDTIVYTTMQSYFLHPELRDPNVYLVLDEAHIQEPQYVVMRNYLQSYSGCMLAITATPTPDLPNMFELPSNSQFTITEASKEIFAISDYLKYAAMFSNNRVSLEKVLIFVPTRKHQEQLAGAIRHKVCFLSSQDKIIDPSATVYISTSVSDAGLTIPDVNFVLTMDFDIQVNFHTREDGRFETGTTSFADQVDVSYYPLSEQTLAQRRGRTGRTCDGVFIKFHVLDIEVKPFVNTPMDFIKGVSPVNSQVWHLLPKYVQDSLPEGFKICVHVFDRLPTQTFTGYCNILAKVISEGKNGVNWLEYWLESVLSDENPKSTVIVEPFASDLPPFLPKTDDVHMLTQDDLKKDEPESKDPIIISQPPSPATSTSSVNFKRINVSGAGLLCGVRALRGLLYTHLEICPSVDYLREIIIREMPQIEGISDDEYNNNFTWNQLTEVAWDTFGLAVGVEVNGVKIKLPQNVMDEQPEFIALMYLDSTGPSGHYNYYGTQVPPDAEDDAKVREYIGED